MGGCRQKTMKPFLWDHYESLWNRFHRNRFTYGEATDVLETSHPRSTGNSIKVVLGRLATAGVMERKRDRFDRRRAIYRMRRVQFPKRFPIPKFFRISGRGKRNALVFKGCGRTVDKRGRYFVLRYDVFGGDPHAMVAMKAYAKSVQRDDPGLSKDIFTEMATAQHNSIKGG